ncbi:MAG: DUF4349 domain-containing protein [Actinomycetota bacterium]|nr:DUF4349 domain-containing protein [Actinomycetota bacterium]
MAHVNTPRRGFGAAAALALLSLTACGGDLDSSSGTTAPAAASESPAGDRPIDGGGEATADTAGGSQSVTGGQTGTNGQTGQTGQSTGDGIPSNALDPGDRLLVITMTVGVEVADAASAVDQVIALAEAHGGQLYNSNLDLSDPETASGDLVFKLPPAEVDAFLSGLEPGIGRRTGMQGTTSDVTRQVTDLDAQILSAAASVNRVRALLDEASNLGEVVQLEGELSSRQTHLEQLLAQRADLSGQAALATITVHLTTAPAPAPEVVADEAPPAKDSTGIGDAFRKGWDAFVAVLAGIALFVGYTAPFLVLGGLALLVLWRLNRRARRNRSVAPPRQPAPAADRRTSEPDFEAAARIP